MFRKTCNFTFSTFCPPHRKRGERGQVPKIVIGHPLIAKPCPSNRSAERNIYNIPIHKTSRYKSSVLYRTIKTWNDIPTKIKTTDSNFKKTLQTYITKIKYPPEV